jgi:hypothetical protein
VLLLLLLLLLPLHAKVCFVVKRIECGAQKVQAP